MYPANPYKIRPSTAADHADLRRLAEVSGARPLSGPALIAEMGGRAAAAVALDDGQIISAPGQRTSFVRQVLTMRMNALRAVQRTPSLRERIREGLAPRADAPGAIRFPTPDEPVDELDELSLQFEEQIVARIACAWAGSPC